MEKNNLVSHFTISTSGSKFRGDKKLEADKSGAPRPQLSSGILSSESMTPTRHLHRQAADHNVRIERSSGDERATSRVYLGQTDQVEMHSHLHTKDNVGKSFKPIRRISVLSTLSSSGRITPTSINKLRSSDLLTVSKHFLGLTWQKRMRRNNDST